LDLDYVKIHPQFAITDKRKKEKNWCVPFGTQRVEAEGMSIRMNKDIEMNPKADDSHPSTYEA
jgi:hypothetical protein